MPPSGKPKKIDSVVYEKNLESLASLIKEPISKARLNDWISQENHRGVLLEDTVWGTIRWSRKLGRPLGATLAGGFVVHHEYYALKLIVEPGGAIKDVGKWVSLPTPSTWDGPHDAENYRVSFLAHAIKGWQNHLWVTFSDSGWDVPPRVRAGYRRIKPLGDYFTSIGKPIVLDEYQVVRESILNTTREG